MGITDIAIIEEGNYRDVANVQEPTTTQDFIMSIDQAVTTWLAEFTSVKTERAYRDGINSFRELLHTSGYDLDASKHIVSLAASSWCARSETGEPVSAATYNQRRSILSSFYNYAILHEVLAFNPLQLVKSKKATTKDAANYMKASEVTTSLASIDRSTLEGLRDYALLSLAIMTGRRASELATLTWGNISTTKRSMVIHFEHCKGNKKMSDDIQPGTQKALLAYLHKLYGAGLASLPADAPIFVSFSRNNFHKQITIQTVSNICKRYLGTSKVHTTRHTFAVNMETAGAKLSDIGARLGHANLKTTSDYLARLHSAENEYGNELEKMFGI